MNRIPTEPPLHSGQPPRSSCSSASVYRAYDEMPLYSLTLLTRPLMKRAQIAAVVERMGAGMMQRGAMVVGLEHYGPTPLAYEVRRPRIGGVEGGRFSAANWLELRFVASPTALREATESLNSDPRVLRWQVLKERDLMPPNGWLSYERTLRRARMAGREQVAEMVRRPALPTALPDVSATALLNRKVKRDRRRTRAHEAMAAARKKLMGVPSQGVAPPGQSSPTAAAAGRHGMAGGRPAAAPATAASGAAGGGRSGKGPRTWRTSLKNHHPSQVAMESGSPASRDSLVDRGPVLPGQRPPWPPSGQTTRKDVT